MDYDFIRYTPLTQEKAPKLAILIHGYAVNGFVMGKMANILQEFMPSLEVLSLHGNLNLLKPRKLKVPKTLFMPKQAMTEDGYLAPKWQRSWFRSKGPFHTWRAPIVHTAVHLENFIKKQAALRDLQINDIALCGFSMGGALASYTGLLMKDELACAVSHSAPFLVRVKPRSQPNMMFLFGTPDASISDHQFKQSVENIIATNPHTTIAEMAGLGHRMSRDSCEMVAQYIRNCLT